MGRQRRPDLPGLVVHLAARTIRRERRFTPRLRTATIAEIARVLPHSGARLLAFVVMSNHLHLVVQQGERPLFELMQPLVRRLAHMLQRTHGFEGPAFWGPYLSVPCLDPRHARNAIAYANLNPVRAGICRCPASYRWSSHGLFAAWPDGRCTDEVAPVAPLLDVAVALPLFATGPGRSPAELRDDYLGFIDWRLGRDDDDIDAGNPPKPAGAAPDGRLLAAPRPGENAWGPTLSPLFHSPVRPGSRSPDVPKAPNQDLQSVVSRLLASEAPGLPLDAIRGKRIGRGPVRLRHRIIRRLHSAGHQGVRIARFFNLSESAVSAVLRKPRD